MTAQHIAGLELASGAPATPTAVTVLALCDVEQLVKRLSYFK